MQYRLGPSCRSCLPKALRRRITHPGYVARTTLIDLQKRLFPWPGWPGWSRSKDCVLSFVRLEEIYDAATDNESFDLLSVRLARMLDARSGVLHWRPASEGLAEEEISYSGYFSDEQMDEYARSFVGLDLWSDAVTAPHALNRAWDCADLIPHRIYESSSIFNDWIRPMGDDTMHGIGAALRTQSIVAEMGFHRGRSQGAFSENETKLLNEYLGHIRSVLEIRERLIGSERGRLSAHGSLDVVGYAVFTLRPSGHLLHCNAAAELLVAGADGLRIRAGRLEAARAGERSALAAAIDRAAAPDGPEPSALFVRGSSGCTYEVSIVSAPAASGRQIVVAVSDPERVDATLPGRLRSLYGLSAAEAEIAVGLSQGAAPRELSDERRTALDTVRTQIKSVSAKLGCQRQSEIVALVRGLPHFHTPAPAQRD